MKVALVNPTPLDHYAPCVRALSARLRQQGHTTRLIFLPADTYGHRFEKNHITQLASSMVADVLELVSDCDAVGVSFLTSMFDPAVQVTRAIQATMPGKPLFWGGFHVTTMPFQALEFVDTVCVGEGEDALVELLERLELGRDPTDVRNFWFRTPQGRVIGNPLRPLIQDLDALPFIDFDFADDWTYDRKLEHLVRLDWARWKLIGPKYLDRSGNMRLAYKAMITRGCPHKCAYCGVAFAHDLYKGQRYLRRRSVEHMIGEIRSVVRRYPEIGLVHFQDDVFFSTSTEEILKFSEAWSREIGMPFRAQCSPTTINAEKYGALVDAGLTFTELGIQTGSADTMRMYKRGMSNEQLHKAVDIIRSHVGKTHIPDYHVILDNPWETTDDVLRGLRLLWTLPKPYNLLPSSLVPYPGTEFYHKVIEDGMVTDELRQIYRKGFHTPNGNYLNFLFFLTLFNELPKEIPAFLAQERLVAYLNQRRFDRFWGKVYEKGEILRQLQKLWTVARKGKLLEVTDIRELKRIANQMK
jgi:anaerobic magnesium-protoporphyrin IX monomethyl ester cyclase